MLVFGGKLAVILAAIFRRRALGVPAKQAAEVVAVREAAVCGNVLNFQVIAFEKLSRMLETGSGQVFIESHAAGLLKKVRKVVG